MAKHQNFTPLADYQEPSNFYYSEPNYPRKARMYDQSPANYNNTINDFRRHTTNRSADKKQTKNHKPISLIEAFDRKVEYELNKYSKKLSNLNATQLNWTQSEIEKNQPKSTPVHHREEHIRAATIDIELNAALRNEPNNELLNAIDCLRKAEKMNRYDRMVHRAEEAVKNVPAEHAEEAAVLAAQSFHMHNVTPINTIVPGTIENGIVYKPIEIIGYMGMTNPNDFGV